MLWPYFKSVEITIKIIVTAIVSGVLTDESMMYIASYH